MVQILMNAPMDANTVPRASIDAYQGCAASSLENMRGPPQIGAAASNIIQKEARKAAKCMYKMCKNQDCTYAQALAKKTTSSFALVERDQTPFDYFDTASNDLGYPNRVSLPGFSDQNLDLVTKTVSDLVQPLPDSSIQQYFWNPSHLQAFPSQTEGLISYQIPSLSFISPKPTFPRMRLRFLARLTSSHGMGNSFDCNNTIVGKEIPSHLRQDCSLQSIEPTHTSTTLSLCIGISKEPQHSAVLLSEANPFALKSRDIVEGIRQSSWSESRERSCARFFSPTNIDVFLRIFFQIWHPNWPVIHKPTFDPTIKSPKLIAALSLIGASLSPDRKHQDQAMVWLEALEQWNFLDPDFSEDIIPQTEDDCQISHVRQRLEAVQAAYAVVLLMNWEGDTKQRRRARRTRFPEIVHVARTLYPFAIPRTSEDDIASSYSIRDQWAAFALQEELVRTLLYIFLLDSAFVMFYDMNPCMVIRELQFGLAATDDRFSAPNAETWLSYTQVEAQSQMACRQVILSQAIDMIMSEQFGGAEWEIFEQMNPLNLFAIASGEFCHT
ncbi:hypothetical protein FBEOM_11509 [Fusarium beomiforme]|uniref:Xylanolytic transcriptional activator regulatory domain-containing protein n=1 Tax=Fusarium beomiforme TaxID=44412 RepID=A0A9P5DRP5_9HYPO|nr:hypothetical protein FBEOM_11509 [Fusarium beomiforme]